jgi:hypothetical protein
MKVSEFFQASNPTLTMKVKEIIKIIQLATHIDEINTTASDFFTFVPIKLQQIAEVMEIGLSQLFGLDEKNFFNLAGTHNTQGDNWYVNSPSNEQIEYKHELEKANLIIEQQQKEIDYLKQQMNDFREMNNLLKKSP